MTLTVYDQLDQGGGARRCSINGCGRPYYATGFCKGHYGRSRRGTDMGPPLEVRFRDAESAFNAFAGTGDGCQVWTGWLSPGGYGKFKTDGKSTFAHRYAWERANGPIPDGMVIDHACRNPPCVNVGHLRLATQTENTRNISGPKSNNKHSGVRNVGKMNDRWRVRITKDGTVHQLGCYDTIEEASAVAEAGRARLFGEFAGKG